MRAVVEARRLGEQVSLGRSASRVGTGILIALGVITAHPAAAQIAFGSPADPPRIAIGGGAFDVLPHINPSASKTTGLALSEYRFGDTVLDLGRRLSALSVPAKAPSTAMAASASMSIFSEAIGADAECRGRVLPTAARASIWARGGEFRTGAEFAYRFDRPEPPRGRHAPHFECHHR